MDSHHITQRSRGRAPHCTFLQTAKQIAFIRRSHCLVNDKNCDNMSKEQLDTRNTLTRVNHLSPMIVTFNILATCGASFLLK